MSQQKDSQIISIVKEAHRRSHKALNAVHGSRLVENHEVAATANAFAGKTVEATPPANLNCTRFCVQNRVQLAPTVPHSAPLCPL
jgi:hypothetical protein